MNLLSGAGVFVEDQLFATLDAVSRGMTLPDGGEFILVDSVGFISKLPTELIEAFHATLEEAVLADLLVLVHDASNPEWQAQRKVVEHVLASLGADTQPRIDVLNKWDRVTGENLPSLPGAVRTSALTGEGQEELLASIAAALRKQEGMVQVLIPFSGYGALHDLRQIGRLTNEEHMDAGTRVTVTGSLPAIQKVLSKYALTAFQEE